MLLTVICAILGIGLFLIYRWISQNFKYWDQYGMIPSVLGRLFSANIWDVLTFKTNWGLQLKVIYEDPKYKNDAVVGVYALQPALLVRDPELIKSILIRDFECFSKRFLESDLHHDPIGSKTLFLGRYELWKELRSKFSPSFSSGKLKQMYPLFQEVGANLETYLHKQGNRFVCEFKDLAQMFTIDTIATTIFGFSSNSLENPKEELNYQSRQLAHFNFRRFLNMLIICYVPKLSKVFNVKFFFEDSNEFARRAVEVALAERERSGIKRNDMIDVFVKLKSEAAANGMSTKEFKEVIAAQMAIFLAGGTETSSTTIANILFEVAKHSHVQDRLRQEILQAFDNENGSISYETLTGLEYLNMIIDETLRMYPVFPFIEREHLNPSNSGKQFSLKPFYDFNIPKGMGVFISTYGLHYDPKYWHEPEKFNPERFSPENKKQLMPMIYLPFGGGPRNCIGWRMGLLQVAACIVHILKNHYVKLCPQTHLKPEFNAKAFVLQTKGGMYLEAIRDDMCKSAAQNTACNK